MVYTLFEDTVYILSGDMVYTREEEDTMKRKGFVFLRDYCEAIEKLPKKPQYSLYRAIIRYGLTDEISDLPETAKEIFERIAPLIQADAKRYEARSGSPDAVTEQGAQTLCGGKSGR